MTEHDALPTEEDIDAAVEDVAGNTPRNTPVAPFQGLAAIALNMAMKYHDMGMIKDGALYQQYKLEGRNIRVLQLNEVFETAMRIEQHLLGASERIAKMIIEAIGVSVDEREPKEEEEPSDD